MKRVFAVASLLALASCQKSPTSLGERVAEEPAQFAQAEVSADAGARVDAEVVVEPMQPVFEALDPELRMDGLANVDQVHVWRDGLFVPFDTDAVLKYNSEYSRPLGEVLEHEGARGRLMERSSFLLHLPAARVDAGRVWVRAHGGVNNQRLQLNINGKRVGVKNLGAAWETVAFEVPADVVKPGENEFRFSWAASARVGGKKTYGLISALEWGALEGDSDGWDFATRPDAVEGSWSGFSRYEWLVEVPQDSVLEFQVPAGGESDLQVNFRTDEKEFRLDSEVVVSGSKKRVQVDLGAHSGALGALEIVSSAAIEKPVIAVKAAARREPLPRYENVIVLVVDALRSDRLSIYGPTRVETPNFEKYAQNGAVFAFNQAASPSSPPSHASIQTGMIPRVHGVTGDKGKLVVGTKLISSVAKESGISTAYIGNNSFGMGRLREAGKWDEFRQPVSEGRGIDCTALVDEVLDFARQRVERKERFFVSALPFEPHAPYRYHEGITAKYHEGPFLPPVGKHADGYLLVDIMAGRKPMNAQQWGQLEALYDGEVEHMDRCFGTMMEGLASLGVGEKTAVILTSDHGEGMNEHGRLGHAYGHFSELADVPFVIFAPGWAHGARVEAVTSVLDVAPTALSLLGLEVPRQMQGDDATQLATQVSPVPRVMSSEYGRSYSLRSRGWRWITNYDGTEELYHLGSDPKEQRNRMADDVLAKRYLRGMAGFFLEHRSAWLIRENGTWNNFKKRLR